MTTQEKWEELIQQSKVLFAKCDTTFAKCRETFSRCEEHIRYLQDDSDLKRIDKLAEEQQKRIDEMYKLLKREQPRKQKNQ